MQFEKFHYDPPSRQNLYRNRTMPGLFVSRYYYYMSQREEWGCCLALEQNVLKNQRNSLFGTIRKERDTSFWREGLSVYRSL